MLLVPGGDSGNGVQPRSGTPRRAVPVGRLDCLVWVGLVWVVIPATDQRGRPVRSTPLAHRAGLGWSRLPDLARFGAYLSSTASISSCTVTLSATTTPPVSSAALKSMPKSLRLISPVAVKPARVPP